MIVQSFGEGVLNFYRKQSIFPVPIQIYKYSTSINMYLDKIKAGYHWFKQYFIHKNLHILIYTYIQCF